MGDRCQPSADVGQHLYVPASAVLGKDKQVYVSVFLPGAVARYASGPAPVQEEEKGLRPRPLESWALDEPGVKLVVRQSSARNGSRRGFEEAGAPGGISPLQPHLPPEHSTPAPESAPAEVLEDAPPAAMQVQAPMPSEVDGLPLPSAFDGGEDVWVALAVHHPPPVLDGRLRVVDAGPHAELRPRDRVLEVRAGKDDAPAATGQQVVRATATERAKCRRLLATAQHGAPVRALVRRTSGRVSLAPEPAPDAHDGHLRVLCASWNMHGKAPPPRVDGLLRGCRPGVHFDLFAVGSQEAERPIELAVFNSSKARWEATLCDTLGPRYRLVASHTLAALHLAVFVAQDMVNLVSRVRTAHVATGLANAVGNKGGVGICMHVGSTSFCFVSCHLTAHQHAVAARNADLNRIDSQLDLWPSEAARRAGRETCVSDRFDRVFWLGDFNYRINGNRSIVDKLLAPPTAEELRGGGWDGEDDYAMSSHEVLQQNDQLLIALQQGDILRGCVEGVVAFRPTYKFDTRNTDLYDLSPKARIPAWTDRLLHKVPEDDPGAVKLHYYASVDELRWSDHRPVVGDYSVAFDAGAGAPRRQASTESVVEAPGSSTCAVQ